MQNLDEKHRIVMIGMPSHRGIVATPTMISLLKLQLVLVSKKITCEYMNIDYAEIGHSRNVIANTVFDNPAITHLLFIDDDMSFEPELISELIEYDKPIAGAICPKRTINLTKFFEIAASGGSFEQASAESADFVTRFESYSTMEIEGGWVPMAGIGMGITLIKRVVLDEMVERKAVPDRWSSDEQPTLGRAASPFRYGFFDGVYDEELKTILSEDLSFCQRWRKTCNGEIWGNANFEIGHIGQMTYTGKYLNRLMMGKG